MQTITITAADLATARALSGNRKPRLGSYADRWHAAARTAGSRSVHVECDALTPTLRAIADALVARESWCLSFLGYDEIAALCTRGEYGWRDANVRSSLPRTADVRSHAISLAIELVATLDAGEHSIAFGWVNGARALEVAA